MPVTSRKAFSDSMKQQGFTDALVSWMASNLVPHRDGVQGHLQWAFDVAGATAMYEASALLTSHAVFKVTFDMW